MRNFEQDSRSYFIEILRKSAASATGNNMNLDAARIADKLGIKKNITPSEIEQVLDDPEAQKIIGAEIAKEIEKLQQKSEVIVENMRRAIGGLLYYEKVKSRHVTAEKNQETYRSSLDDRIIDKLFGPLIERLILKHFTGSWRMPKDQ